MFTYIRPVKCSVKILNGRKSPAKYFVLVTVFFFKNKHYYTTMAVILYDTKRKNHNKSICTKHCYQFRRVRTDSLRWLQITIDTGTKLKVETEVK